MNIFNIVMRTLILITLLFCLNELTVIKASNEAIKKSTHNADITLQKIYSGL